MYINKESLNNELIISNEIGYLTIEARNILYYLIDNVLAKYQKSKIDNVDLIWFAKYYIDKYWLNYSCEHNNAFNYFREIIKRSFQLLYKDKDVIGRVKKQLRKEKLDRINESTTK